MKLLFLFCLTWLVLPLRADATFPASSESDPASAKKSVPAVPNDNTVLTMDEEFSGGKLDDSRWNKWYPWAVVINRELQAYTLDAFVFPPKGGLIIRAEKQPFLGQKYTSGSIATDGKFLQAYGYFEMKAKLPRGHGYWPAFWIMPPEFAKEGGAEIDVMEELGEDAHAIHLTLHSTDPRTHQAVTRHRVFKGPDFTADEHTFAVSWRPKELVWLIDGVEAFRVEGGLVPSVPEYVLVNLAVGGFDRAPDAETVFPGDYEVQYVRVYRFKDLPPVAPALPRLGPAMMTPEIVHPGDTVTVRTSLTAGNLALPPFVVHLAVTDFFGDQRLSESEEKFSALATGATVPLTGHFTLPVDLVPGTYTVAAKIAFPGRPEMDRSVGCLYRFTVVARR